MSKWLLRTAGVLQIAFAGLQGLMPRGWRTSLAYLTVDDRATMHIFNLMTAYVLLVFAYLLLFHARTLPTVGVSRAAIARLAAGAGVRGDRRADCAAAVSGAAGARGATPTRRPLRMTNVSHAIVSRSAPDQPAARQTTTALYPHAGNQTGGMTE